jgi:hypothetical protein
MDLWRLRRIPGLESAIYHWFSAEAIEIRNGPMAFQQLYGSSESDDVHYGLNDSANGYVQMKMAQSGDMLGKLGRYEAQLLRQVKQHIADLEEFRAKREKDAR